ncbi:MAG: hypothetical protein KDF57_14855, partial [Ottowia sp.]|nr:hypothetical protein [Ottowia sp.]
KWGRLSFAYFSLAKQRKVGAPPGAHPGLQRHHKHYAFNSCLRPSHLGKTTISLKKRRRATRQGFDRPVQSLPKGSARTVVSFSSRWNSEQNQSPALWQRAQPAMISRAAVVPRHACQLGATGRVRYRRAPGEPAPDGRPRRKETER